MRKINNIRCLWNYQTSQKVITDPRNSSFLSHAVYIDLKKTMQVACKMNFEQSFMYSCRTILVPHPNFLRPESYRSAATLCIDLAMMHH